MLLPLFVSSQTDYFGYVTDDETGEPLGFANIIFYQGSEIVGFTESDFSGYFEYTLDHTENIEVEASFLGYNSPKIQLSLTEDKMLLFNLVTEEILLDEIVITCGFNSDNIRCLCNTSSIITYLEDELEDLDFNYWKDEELEEAMKYNLYPNPATDFSQLSFPRGDYQLMVYDLNGRLMITDSILDRDYTRINTENLISGSYFVNLHSEDELVHSYRLMVTKM